MLQELKPLMETLRTVFGQKAIDKLMSHLNSINIRLEDLTKSRDNWRRKYEEIKNNNKLNV